MLCLFKVAVNKIIFLNSYKMKLSIIFGVVHMMFGVALSVVNHVYVIKFYFSTLSGIIVNFFCLIHRHFNKKINILLQFIPQMLFLVLLFLYMVSLMFMKWIWYGPKNRMYFFNLLIL